MRAHRRAAVVATLGLLAGLALAGGGSPVGAAEHGEAVTNGSATTDGDLRLSGLANRTLAIRDAAAGPSGMPNQPGLVTVTVTNTGEQARSEWVTLHLVDEANGSVGPPVDRTRVTVGPGDQRTVELRAIEVLGHGGESQRIQARAGAATDDAIYRFYYPQHTHFTMRTVAAPPVQPGEDGAVRVRVTNEGRPPGAHPDGPVSPGQATVVATVDGRVVDDASVWVPVDERRTVELRVPASALSSGDTVVRVAVGAEHDRRLDSLVRPALSVEGRTDGNGGPGLGAVAAALGSLAAVVAGGWLVRRRATGGER